MIKSQIIICRAYRFHYMLTHTKAGPLRTLLKYIGFIPLSVFIHDVYFLLPGIVKYGRFPVYGKDPDPSSLNDLMILSSGLQELLVVHYLLSLYSLLY